MDSTGHQVMFSQFTDLELNTKVRRRDDVKDTKTAARTVAGVLSRFS
jgi:hypothetical protein